ncbi:hypothetical protein JCM8208_007866 [Rhodotorula glutinis]
MAYYAPSYPSLHRPPPAYTGTTHLPPYAYAPSHLGHHHHHHHAHRSSLERERAWYPATRTEMLVAQAHSRPIGALEAEERRYLAATRRRAGYGCCAGLCVSVSPCRRMGGC